MDYAKMYTHYKYGQAAINEPINFKLKFNFLCLIYSISDCLKIVCLIIVAVFLTASWW